MLHKLYLFVSVYESTGQNWWPAFWWSLRRIWEVGHPYSSLPFSVYDVPLLPFCSFVLFNSYVRTALGKMQAFLAELTQGWRTWCLVEWLHPRQSQTVRENLESGWAGRCPWKLQKWGGLVWGGGRHTDKPEGRRGGTGEDLLLSPSMPYKTLILPSGISDFGGQTASLVYDNARCSPYILCWKQKS